MESARTQATEAIDLLSTLSIFPPKNATDALQFATAGVEKLTSAIDRPRLRGVRDYVVTRKHSSRLDAARSW